MIPDAPEDSLPQSISAQPSPGSALSGGVLFSVFFVVLGLFSVIGADSYKDFYFDLKARYSGVRIDYAKIGDFCGSTGLQMPWESDIQYGLRAFGNNVSAMMAMASIITIAVGCLIAAILGLLRIAGLF